MLILVSGSIRSVLKISDDPRNNIGILLTPRNRNSVASVLATGLPWAVDNGAFSGFDEVAFRKLLHRVAGKPRLLWVVAPDVVCDARLTLFLFEKWLPIMNELRLPIAYVAQDGQEDFSLPLDQFRCLFIGGSTRFKLSQAAGDLAAEAKQAGKLVHMGRVNSRRRLLTAATMDADSVDGSSLSMFGDKYIHKFCRWVRQIKQQQTMFI